MDNFNHRFHAIKEWATKAHIGGWLDQTQLAELEQIELQTADELFAQGNQRPLIVALFGGTGVGKSSLLNRIAGESIAKVGVERPTSKEVTLYLHQAYQIQHKPQDLPIQNTNIQYHSDDRRKLIAWLDMPDIDSTDISNRELVETWLPYIDWLVYVMTPERYQDDIGWRFLQERSHRHHWMFILNHWDQGSPEQLEDLRNKLLQEMFDDPIILRTSCTMPAIEDDFQKLEQTINDALEKHGLELLKQIGLQARIDDLYNQTDRFMQLLGTDGQWKNAHIQWTTTSQETLKKIQVILNTQTDFVDQTLLADKTSALNLFRRNSEENSLSGIQEVSSNLWPQRVEILFEDLTRLTENNLRNLMLPARPFKSELKQWQSNLQQTFKTTLDTALTEAIATPGSGLQRISWKLMRWLTGLLPAVTAGWVITHVLQRFHAGTQGLENFLGLNFTIHSALMIGLSWLIPWLIQRQLQPSAVAAAHKGLKKGIQEYRNILAEQLESIWAKTKKERQKLISLLEKIS